MHRSTTTVRALFSAVTLVAAAACADAPTAVAPEAAPAPRMLRGDQAAEVRPGDFIVIRPEEFTRFGIDAGGPGRADTGPNMAYYGGCYQQLEVLRPSIDDTYCDPYLDPCCPEPPVYPPIEDLDPDPPTTTPVLAQFSYGSSAVNEGWVNTGGILLKQGRLKSWSQSNLNVASFSVFASFRNVGAESGAGCGNVAQQFDSATASGTGSPGYVEVSRVVQWLGTIKWEAAGTHTFTPVSGATGGGTFYSSQSFCA
jgi:hypothetical protein